MTTRSRILLPFAVFLLLVSFLCAMVWETPLEPPFDGVAMDVGSSVWHVVLDDDMIGAYRSPPGARAGPFFEYGAYLPGNAWAVPVWLVAVALAAWPVWWLNRLRGGRALDEPFDGREPGSVRRLLASLALSHLLASYVLYLTWSCFVPMFVRGTLMSQYAMAGHRLVEAPVHLFTSFPNDARYILQFPGTSPWRRVEILVYCLSYAAMLGALLWMIYVRPQRRRRAIRLGLCLSCGYDLRASPDRCPECGRTTERTIAAALT